MNTGIYVPIIQKQFQLFILYLNFQLYGCKESCISKRFL